MLNVSIVIPCRNEEQYIGKCIDSILLQDYPLDHIEVFICDGESDDKTVLIVNDYSVKHANIKLLSNKKKTTPFALNLGIKASNSDIVIILGAHSELYPDYVSNCVKTFEKGNNTACVGGVIENVYENEVAEIIGKAMSSSFGVGNAHFRTGAKEGYVDTVAFGAYKRAVFEQVGYFDEELIRNQDDEFNYRLIKNGYTIFLSKNIRSKYYVRGTFEKLYKQYFQYGYWKVYVNKKHMAVTTFRQVVPLFFVLFLLIGLLLSLFDGFVFLLYAIGLLFYAALSFYSAFKTTSNVKNVFSVMKAFFILHFSYGSGYFKGLVDFFIFQKAIKKEERLTR